MKKVLLIVVCLVFLSATAYAGEELDCDSYGGLIGDYKNDCYPHHEKTDEKDAEIGVGVDIIVHEGDEGSILNKVTVEYKYDINNDDHKTYAVATSKLSDIWAKVKSIFKRGE